MGFTETFSKLKESFFFLLTGFESKLNQFHQDAVTAKPAILSDRLNLAVNL